VRERRSVTKVWLGPALVLLVSLLGMLIALPEGRFGVGVSWVALAVPTVIGVKVAVDWIR